MKLACDIRFHTLMVIVVSVVVANVMILPMSSSAYGLNNNHHQQQKMSIITDKQQQPASSRPSTASSTSRRIFFQKQLPTAAAATMFGITTLSSSPSLANAAEEEIVLPTREVVTTTFDAIRYELSDPNGGVSYMQQRIDESDFAGLLEFTKGYDLELRKLKMGKAKKLLQEKDIKGKGTEYMNAVTFDLIGMNRSSRAGQENKDMANKYLQELRDDVTKFLQLEQTIQVVSD